ncbi:NTP transferase domain-containing protein [Ramlibacter tataouinensis]|uniref:NTP transferase domain-containing protein n=1 Tax=Ramlibacter tataouinensis TaxID=94132 RepID=UPI0022F3F963|nr:NTP transferase domain-containing protein [Ramlibacter tataouinensis]WBY04020.1 NTP transferase domain-containing protein [Ramlibacter tataouinensis]
MIPAKGIATGKSRLAHCLRPGMRERLNLFQLMSTIRAAADAFGPERTYVVSPCAEVGAVVRSEGVRFIRESVPPGLNDALEQARTELATRALTMTVLPVDLPGVSAEALRDLFLHCAPDEALIVPDRATDGTNVLRLPMACPIQFSYGPRSFATHVRLLAMAGFPPRVIRGTCLRDDLDDIRHLRMHSRYSELIAADENHKNSCERSRT